MLSAKFLVLSQYDTPAVDVMYHVLTRGVYDRHAISAGNSYDSYERRCAVGGVFGAYQATFPPTIDWQAEMVDQAFMNEAGKMATERGLVEHVRKWRYDEHNQRMNDSGLFRYVKELWLHSTEQGNAERFVGLMLTLLKNGVTEAEIGMPQYRETIQRLLGSALRTWYFSFRVLIGIT